MNVTIVTKTIKSRIIWGLVLLLSLQAVEAGISVHSMDKAASLKSCASTTEQVSNVTVNDVQNNVYAHDFVDECCNAHFHSSLTAINSINLVFVPVSNNYTEKPPTKYLVDIATPLKPPKAA